MNTYRTLDHVVASVDVAMGGMRIKQPLPQPRGGLTHIDPFLLLHHARLRISGGGEARDLGVPPHPHRGFEPVTFIYQGGVHHRDSLGNDSVVLAGGVQWMTAGRGVIHSERPPQALAAEGGLQEIIQLWINLPERHKMTPPRYQSLTAEETPSFTSEDGRVAVRIVAGEVEGTQGPVETHTPLLAFNAVFEKGGGHDFRLPEGYAACAYLLDGRCRFNEEQEVSGEHLVAFGMSGEGFRAEALEATRMLVLAGTPLGEPVVASGPFVMSTSADLYQAMRDYQEGAMGRLDERF